jgi:ribose/xylose/arabinose/galactoside ABC-type transport system permease subunit
MRQISVNLIVSVGMTLVVLTAGINNSDGSMLILCGAITAGMFKHHVAMTRGKVVDYIEEAVDNYLGWDLYRYL